jgi:hypothetical protein
MEQGEDPNENKSVMDKKEFEEYIRKKKSRKLRKNKGVLKSACAGCLSSYYEQYNPLINCP